MEEEEEGKDEAKESIKQGNTPYRLRTLSSVQCSLDSLAGLLEVVDVVLIEGNLLIELLLDTTQHAKFNVHRMDLIHYRELGRQRNGIHLS